MGGTQNSKPETRNPTPDTLHPKPLAPSSRPAPCYGGGRSAEGLETVCVSVSVCGTSPRLLTLSPGFVPSRRAKISCVPHPSGKESGGTGEEAHSVLRALLKAYT